MNVPKMGRCTQIVGQEYLQVTHQYSSVEEPSHVRSLVPHVGTGLGKDAYLVVPISTCSLSSRIVSREVTGEAETNPWRARDRR
jgi:hypothetical protein